MKDGVKRIASGKIVQAGDTIKLLYAPGMKSTLVIMLMRYFIAMRLTW